MSVLLTQAAYTPEDLLTMHDGDRYELVYGRLKEIDMGALSSLIGGRLFRRLANFCGEDGPWLVWPEGCGYQCFPHAPNLVRKPDTSALRRERLPGGEVPEGHLRLAPDLAAEVLSPNDLVYETDQKVEDYLRAGTRLVWVIHPLSRIVLIYRANGTIVGIREHDELDGEDVLPGFRCPVRELFHNPVMPGPAA